MILDKTRGRINVGRENSDAVRTIREMNVEGRRCLLYVI